MFFKSKPKKTESFEIITLRLSGMRFTTDYEIINKDGKAEITQYQIKYSDGKDERAAEKQAVCETDEVLKLLNDCRVASWDGFYGKHPRGVKDGTMFRFSAKINGAAEIHAEGSQNFPGRFHEFRDGLYALLNKGEEKRQ